MTLSYYVRSKYLPAKFHHQDRTQARQCDSISITAASVLRHRCRYKLLYLKYAAGSQSSTAQLLSSVWTLMRTMPSRNPDNDTNDCSSPIKPTLPPELPGGPSQTPPISPQPGLPEDKRAETSTTGSTAAQSVPSQTTMLTPLAYAQPIHSGTDHPSQSHAPPRAISESESPPYTERNLRNFLSSYHRTPSPHPPANPPMTDIRDFAYEASHPLAPWCPAATCQPHGSNPWAYYHRNPRRNDGK
jgi:hypothetical protein